MPVGSQLTSVDQGMKEGSDVSLSGRPERLKSTRKPALEATGTHMVAAQINPATVTMRRAKLSNLERFSGGFLKQSTDDLRHQFSELANVRNV
jgi:hypothetical protein